MSAGREFHVCGAATENAHRASSVCTRGTVSSGVTDDRRPAGQETKWVYSTAPGTHIEQENDKKQTYSKY